MKKTIIGLLLLIPNFLEAQCNSGEAELEIIVNTDDFGYEGYWQLVPAANTCGVGTIADGGNAAVGCNGGGAQNQTPGGYGDNLVVTEGPWCLTIGSQYALIYVDDWGDGGFSFDILVNGFQIGSYTGTGTGGTYIFTLQEPDPFDLSVTASNVYDYLAIGSFNMEATVFNNGSNTITSYNLNYAIDGGTVQTSAVTSTGLSNNTEETATHSVPLNFTANGTHTVKIWADNMNGGNSDDNTFNDTLTKQIVVGPGRANIIDEYMNGAYNVIPIAGIANQVSAPTDLDFHPNLTNKELWVCNKGTENSGGSTVTIYNAGEPNQTTLYKQDGNAWHFMSLPTGIAFSQNGNWANSPGVFDANHNGGDAFTGPSLWSSDMTIYAEPSGGNGSHLDMLHASPYSQGIAFRKKTMCFGFLMVIIKIWSDMILWMIMAREIHITATLLSGGILKIK